jgi:hypothetical protein
VEVPTNAYVIQPSKRYYPATHIGVGVDFLSIVQLPMMILSGDPLLSSIVRAEMFGGLRQVPYLQLEVKQNLQNIVNVLADFDPVGGRRQIDSLDFMEVWDLFQATRAPESPMVSKTTVRRAWNDVLRELDVSVRVCKSVSKCDRCIELRTMIRQVMKMILGFQMISISFVQAKLSQKGPIKDAIVLHKQEVMTARQFYHSRKARGRDSSTEIASVIIDAMDQVRGFISFLIVLSILSI